MAVLAGHFDRVVPAGELLTVERFLELMKGAGFPPDDEWYCVLLPFASRLHSVQLRHGCSRPLCLPCFGVGFNHSYLYASVLCECFAGVV